MQSFILRVIDTNVLVVLTHRAEPLWRCEHDLLAGDRLYEHLTLLITTRSANLDPPLLAEFQARSAHFLGSGLAQHLGIYHIQSLGSVLGGQDPVRPLRFRLIGCSWWSAQALGTGWFWIPVTETTLLRTSEVWAGPRSRPRDGFRRTASSTCPSRLQAPHGRKYAIYSAPCTLSVCISA